MADSTTEAVRAAGFRPQSQAKIEALIEQERAAEFASALQSGAHLGVTREFRALGFADSVIEEVLQAPGEFEKVRVVRPDQPTRTLIVKKGEEVEGVVSRKSIIELLGTHDNATLQGFAEGLNTVTMERVDVPGMPGYNPDAVVRAQAMLAERQKAIAATEATPEWQAETLLQFIAEEYPEFTPDEKQAKQTREAFKKGATESEGFHLIFEQSLGVQRARLVFGRLGEETPRNAVGGHTFAHLAAHATAWARELRAGIEPDMSRDPLTGARTRGYRQRAKAPFAPPSAADRLGLTERPGMIRGFSDAPGQG